MIGFINIYKPSGITSNEVIQKLKKKFNIKKLGHMGTLDPIACGLLPVAIGKATRLFDYMLSKIKVYNVIFDFGYLTDTLDVTGKIINTCSFIPNEQDIKNTIKSFVGKMSQMPPKFSAKNVNGIRAYDLARKGVDFDLTPKEIEIFEFTLTKKIDNSRYKFKIACSAGTYIRAIGRDLGEKLGTFATMSFLERSSVGFFNLDNSVELDKLLNERCLTDYIISPLQVLSNFEKIEINNDIYKKLLEGKIIKYKEIKNNSFLIYNSSLIGVCKPHKDQLKLDTYLEE